MHKMPCSRMTLYRNIRSIHRMYYVWLLINRRKTYVIHFSVAQLQNCCFLRHHCRHHYRQPSGSCYFGIYIRGRYFGFLLSLHQSACLASFHKIWRHQSTTSLSMAPESEDKYQNANPVEDTVVPHQGQVSFQEPNPTNTA